MIMFHTPVRTPFKKRIPRKDRDMKSHEQKATTPNTSHSPGRSPLTAHLLTYPPISATDAEPLGPISAADPDTDPREPSNRRLTTTSPMPKTTLNSPACCTNANGFILGQEYLERQSMQRCEGVRYPHQGPHTPGDIGGGRTHFQLGIWSGDAQDFGVDTPTNPKARSAKGYVARQRVAISGLCSDAGTPLNGKQGTLVGWDDYKKRWAVSVDGKEDPVNVRPANLDLVRPSPDQPLYWPAGVHIKELVFDLGSDPPVARLARREVGGEAVERPLTDEELDSNVLHSGALIDLRGDFRLATVVSLYHRKAYEGSDWRAEATHLRVGQVGLSGHHWNSHIRATVNDGRARMTECACCSDTMFCGHEPAREGWMLYTPETGMGQTVGQAVHETWKVKDSVWRVKDLCEVVLARYRVRRDPEFKPGSWLHGARARVACDDEEDPAAPDAEDLPTRLRLSQFCGDQRWGAWAIVGGTEFSHDE